MANYVVSDESLGSVADAIRQKCGTSAPLEYPAEFISAIEAISTADEIIVTDVKDGQGVVTRTINAGDNPVTRIVRGAPPLDLNDAKAGNMVSLTQQGLCTQSGTPTPDAPVDIVCNNGALKYGALGANLYDPSTAVFEVGYYYAPTAYGAKTAALNNYIYNAYIPIEAGEAYVFYGRRKSGNNLSQYNRIHWYDVEKTYISTSTYVGGTMGKGVAPDNAAFARLSCNPQGLTTAITEETVLGYNWTFCKGTAEVAPFVPFVGGVKPVGTPEVLTVGADGGTAQTASVPMLLSVGDVKDESEIISGLLTHRIGIKIFDGTENWRASSSANIYILDSAIAVGLTAICTHFVKVSNTTSAANMQDGSFKGHASNAVLYFKDVSAGNVDGFKSRLAAQYAAGTPVIMLYSLATETTEQLTPQPLTVADGSQQLSVQAAVSGIQIEAVFPGTFPG